MFIFTFVFYRLIWLTSLYTNVIFYNLIQHIPEGMAPEDIHNMSEDDLLNMDYFLNEEYLFDDETGVEGFYIF